MDEQLNTKTKYLKGDLITVLVLMLVIIGILVFLAIIDAKNNILSTWARELMNLLLKKEM